MRQTHIYPFSKNKNLSDSGLIEKKEKKEVPIS